jgi:RNA polymerase sigma factor (sigma-70 family)
LADAAVRYGDAPAAGRARAVLALLGDDRLVEQVRRGSHAAFESLYERHHRGILAFCRHMLGSAQDAEEAVQQTFTAAYADLRRGELPVAPKPWLYGVARHRCLAMLRRRRVEAGARTSAEPATPPLAEEVERRSEVRDLLHGVSRLPEPQRTALVLFGLCGHPQSDVAAVIGCDEPRVRALVYQARSSLLEDRRARETPCHEVREKLALARGGALRRRSVRRHVKFCPSCAEFRAEVLRQRRLMALAPQLGPSVALKAQVLAAVGMAATTGGGAAGPVGLGGSLGLAKVVTAALVLTATPVGGGILLHEQAGRHAARSAVAPPARPAARAVPEAATATPPAGARVAGAGPVPAPPATASRPAPPPPRPAPSLPSRPGRAAPTALAPPSPVEPSTGSGWPQQSGDSRPADPPAASPADGPPPKGHGQDGAGGDTSDQAASGGGSGQGPGHHKTRSESAASAPGGKAGGPEPTGTDGGGPASPSSPGGGAKGGGGDPAAGSAPPLPVTVTTTSAAPPCPDSGNVPAGCSPPQGSPDLPGHPGKHHDG